MKQISEGLKRIFLALTLVIVLAGCRQAPVASDPGSETLADLMDGLRDLPAEDFMEEAFKRLILRHPEDMTRLGLAGLYGARYNQLAQYDMDSVLLTQSFEAALLEQANAYNRDALSAETQLNLDVFIWYLKDRVDGHPYQWFDCFLLNETGFLVDQYIYLLLVAQPFQTEADVQDYLARLSAIGVQVDQIIDYMKAQEGAGIHLPYPLYVSVMEDLGAHRWQVGRKTPFIQVLSIRLRSFEGISSEKAQSYFATASETADEVILPAFERLMSYLYSRADTTSESIGLSSQPNGVDYYRYRLGLMSTLNWTAEEIHAFGLSEVAALGDLVRTEAETLGYDASLPLQEIFRQATVDRSYALGLDILVTLRVLLMDVEEEMDSAFYDELDDDLVMVPVFEGGFYVPAALDGSRRAAFYADFTGREAHFDMPTQVYHETYPGRHYLYSVINSSDLPLYRKAIHFDAFDRGWAQYAAYLAWEMGLYEDDPNANLGRLQVQLLRAAQLVVDTGIHTMGWDAQEAARYLVDYAGITRPEANQIVLVQMAQPGTAVSSYLGFAFILDLRRQAEVELGTDFDLRAFHQAVLDAGSLPLPLLEAQIDAFIEGG